MASWDERTEVSKALRARALKGVRLLAKVQEAYRAIDELKDLVDQIGLPAHEVRKVYQAGDAITSLVSFDLKPKDLE